MQTRRLLVPSTIGIVAQRASIVLRANDNLPRDLLVGFCTHGQTESEKERIHHSVAHPNRPGNNVARHDLKGAAQHDEALGTGNVELSWCSEWEDGTHGKDKYNGT